MGAIGADDLSIFKFDFAGRCGQRQRPLDAAAFGAADLFGGIAGGGRRMSRTYLDYNATAPLRPEAREALLAALDIGNPSSVHFEGRQARALVETLKLNIKSVWITN